MNCSCHHPANVHAPVQDFGVSMCLSPDCDCEGPIEQVAALAADRKRRLSPTAERLVEVIASVLSNPMQRTTEDMARNVAAAVLGEFELEARS